MHDIFEHTVYPSFYPFYRMDDHPSDDHMRRGGRKRKGRRVGARASRSNNLNINIMLQDEIVAGRKGKNSSFSQFRLAPANIHFANPPRVALNSTYAVPNNLTTNTLEQPRLHPEFVPSARIPAHDPSNPAGIRPTPAQERASASRMSHSPLVAIPESRPEHYLTQPPQKPTGRGNYVEPRPAQETAPFGGYFPLGGQQPKDRSREFAQERHRDVMGSSSSSSIRAMQVEDDEDYPELGVEPRRPSKAQPGSRRGRKPRLESPPRHDDTYAGSEPEPDFRKRGGRLSIF